MVVTSRSSGSIIAIYALLWRHHTQNAERIQACFAADSLWSAAGTLIAYSSAGRLLSRHRFFLTKQAIAKAIRHFLGGASAVPVEWHGITGLTAFLFAYCHFAEHLLVCFPRTTEEVFSFTVFL
jgi:hypothetical protein